MVVVAPDRPGLLAVIVGLLAVRGQSVRSAVATTDGAGVAVDRFTIQSVFDRDPDWSGFRDELEAAVLDGTCDLAARVEDRSRRYRPARSTAARPPDPVVLVHRRAASDATVVEVRSPDDVGVLFRIARTFTGLGLDIHQARVVTLGQEVVDTFYVRDGSGAAVDDRAERDHRGADGDAHRRTPDVTARLGQDLGAHPLEDPRVERHLHARVLRFRRDAGRARRAGLRSAQAARAAGSGG